jgi:hypothetical protein
MKKLHVIAFAAIALFAAFALDNGVAGAALAPSHVMSNHGTGALTSVEIIPQVWALHPDSANPDYPMSELQAVTNHLAASSYASGLEQYGFNGSITVDPIRGSLHDRVNCIPRSPGSHTNTVILAQWLFCDWANGTGGSYGHLPVPNGHRVYVIFVPEGTTVTDPGNTNNCSQRLGYHSFLPYVNSRDGYYIVVPLHCANSIAGVTDVLSHEIAETITDPNLSGWYDSSSADGEVSDVCDADRVPAFTLDWLAVNAYWSNTDGACIAGSAHGLAVSGLSVTTAGSTATATASVYNNGAASISVPEILLHGQSASDPTGKAMSAVSFSAAHNITIAPGTSYQYTGSVTLSQSGAYTFWMVAGATIKSPFERTMQVFTEIPGSGSEAGAKCSRTSIRFSLQWVHCTVPVMPAM